MIEPMRDNAFVLVSYVHIHPSRKVCLGRGSYMISFSSGSASEGNPETIFRLTPALISVALGRKTLSPSSNSASIFRNGMFGYPPSNRSLSATVQLSGRFLSSLIPVR
jgi:hypothetical protein